MSIRKMLFMGLIMFLGACSSDLFVVHNGNMPAEERVAKLQKGQSKEEVMELLGAPSTVTGLNDNHWVYMSSTVKKVAFLRPQELERDIVAITFKDNIVTSVEHYDLADGNDIAVDKDVTTSADSKVGFFRKYFGGVGQYSMFGRGNEKEP
ncbi:MAG: outer membrane protein assembly factor BamE [Alphaproteobacteria bacterium]|nr:outer membrane protein assembly factor BamE [Alphaproteobacteria bacterium]